MNYHLDFETFSKADLDDVGTYRYAEDPSTEILMFAIASDDEGPYLWVNPKYRDVTPSDPRADRLVRAIGPDDVVWAHYATFEVAITRYNWDRDVGLPKPKLHQWRCTAVLARCAAMPSGLEQLAVALKLDDTKFQAKAKKKLFTQLQDDGSRVMPADRPKGFQAFGEYCLQDIRVERSVYLKLKPFELRGGLLDAWLFDLRMNDRGFPVNEDGLRKAQKIILEATAELGGKFRKLTGLNPTQREKVQNYLLELGCEMPNMKADTVEEVLEEMDTDHPAYEVLHMYSLVQFAAVKKVQVMLNCVCSDGWCRGMFLFYGAGTGRWSGRGVQPQNFKRPTIKNADGVYRLICNGATREDIEMLYGNVLDAISSCIRNFIHWDSGNLLDADYNAVEARIICWLAGQLDRLDDWARGVDQYKAMAGVIYGVPASEIINPSDRREVGKRTILGCGFNMGAKKYKSTLKNQYGIIVSMDLAEKAVAAYRQTHNLVRSFWWKMQDAATKAVSNPGQVYKAGEHIRFWTARVNDILFLFMRLPSGRKIVYPWPELRNNPDWDKPEITFYGNIKGNHWGRVKTYGGKLAENATQGVAFDIMANGSVVAEREGADIIMLVHDQAEALHVQGIGINSYTQWLTQLPPWADGLPIKAEGRIVPYYKK